VGGDNQTQRVQRVSNVVEQYRSFYDEEEDGEEDKDQDGDEDDDDGDHAPARNGDGECGLPGQHRVGSQVSARRWLLLAAR
jgi:hypothetical protein